jgi:threonine dehydratase
MPQEPEEHTPILLEHIAEAAAVVDPVFLHSPQLYCEQLSERLGMRLVCKVETLNPIRSFKGRGADFFVHQLGGEKQPLVCASAGNFGQGLAYAARRRGIPLHVFAATSANPVKVERMRRLGAEVMLSGDDFDAAKLTARAAAEREGWRFVEDGHEPAISEGAGTIAVELCQWPERFDVVLVPVGNGALINGIGTWMKVHSPTTRVIGVCAAGAPAMERSWRAGRLVTMPSIATIADGIGVRIPVPAAIDVMRHIVDEMVLIAEDELRQAMRLLLDDAGLVAEPAGAAGIAAALHLREALRGQLVAVPICGSNVAPGLMEEL